eukprot:TRINITY_DN893_c0_g1_i2.p1 TRINITY_DN893_c0_g1~~TRINITY_DN893_c0_g1_i2.p1  ORF type:complete len:434 (+),score=72.95 TRINITY_DN893_c0_g1_i2:171-1304(+)
MSQNPHPDPHPDTSELLSILPESPPLKVEGAGNQMQKSGDGGASLPTLLSNAVVPGAKTTSSAQLEDDGESEMTVPSEKYRSVPAPEFTSARSSSDVQPPLAPPTEEQQDVQPPLAPPTEEQQEAPAQIPSPEEERAIQQPASLPQSTQESVPVLNELPEAAKPALDRASKPTKPAPVKPSDVPVKSVDAAEARLSRSGSVGRSSTTCSKPSLSPREDAVDLCKSIKSINTVEQTGWKQDPTMHQKPSKTFRVRVERGSSRTLLGLAFLGTVSRGEGALKLAGVEEKGLFAEWNSANPCREVRVNDFIVQVNDVRGNPDELLHAIDLDGPLDLVILRPLGSVPHKDPGSMQKTCSTNSRRSVGSMLWQSVSSSKSTY